MAVLYDLATEIIVSILSRLDYRDVLRCQAVSRELCDIVRSTPALQYLIELAVAGMVDNTALPQLGINERFSKLLEYQSALKNPRCEIVERIAFALERLSWGYSGNILAYRYYYPEGEDDRGKPGLYNCVDIVHLPETALGVPTWRLRLDETFEGVSMCPAQDLLVLWKWIESANSSGRVLSVTLLSLTDGRPILPARIMIAPERQNTSRLFMRMTIQIANNILVICMLSAAATVVDLIFIYWPTCTIQSRFLREARQDETFDNVCVLSDRHFALPVKTHSSAYIELYTLPFEAPIANQAGNVKLVATFALPPLQADIELPSVFLTATTPSGLYAPEMHSRPFISSTSPALLTILLVYGEPLASNDMTFHHFLVVTSVRTLLAAVGENCQDTSHTPSMRWEEWGPSATRWFNVEMLHAFSTANHAHRIYFPSGLLLDFNPLDIARDLHRGTSPQSASMIVTEPTVIPRGNIFVSDVVSKLAYRSASCSMPVRTHDVYGGEDWIVAQPNAATGGRLYDLHVLSV